ncbi:hypothetical protein IM40_03220 [Candidatus Paracaedimonas acanthamoebae]|nr:hypothetical protein IM40_03220 [Candidatus Paracaedimonas acanthamoebae]
MALNPLHSGDLDNVVRLADDDADDNKDSLVLRVRHGGSSVMLTGDATQATTRRIKQNYKGNLDSLKSTVLLASHHGSAEHGCNGEEWVKLVDPQYVLISHGHKYGHPQAQAYENFKKSSRLKRVPLHHVLVGKGTNKHEDYYEGSLHTTPWAIYSTLNSGDLTLELLPTTLNLTSEIAPTLEKKEEEAVEVVKITDSPTGILLSAKKGPLPQDRRGRESGIIPIQLSFEEAMKVDTAASAATPTKEEKTVSTAALTRKPKRKLKEVSASSPEEGTDEAPPKILKQQSTSPFQQKSQEKKK